MDSRTKNLIIDNIPALRELINGFTSYQVAKIDIKRIIYFITQFETYERVRVVLQLIKNIDFIDSNRMTYLLKSAYEKIPSAELTKPLLSSLGNIQDSSAVVCYQLLKVLFDSEKDTLGRICDTNSLGKYITEEKPSSIIFFDDNITSGTQLYQFFQELIKPTGKAEMIKISLKPDEYELLKEIPIKVCYAIQLSENADESINKIREDFGLNLQVYSGKVDFNNYLDYQTKTMDSEEQSKQAKDFIREIAESLYQDKDWSPETIYHRLLGYGNLGKLTVFYYNVPKSLIPIFWKSGKYGKDAWIPLFPETQEQKKIEREKIEMDFYKLEAIDSWLNDTHKKRSPVLKFGIYFDGIKDELTIVIPKMEIISEYVRKHIPPPNLQYESNYKQPRKATLQEALDGFYVQDSEKISPEDYKKYKLGVDNYNKDFEKYLNQVSEYIMRLASKKTIEFHVSNTGNIAATNCTVKLSYNTGDLLMDDFDDLEIPSFKKDVPKLVEFDSTIVKSGTMILHYEPVTIKSIFSPEKKEKFRENTDYECSVFKDERVGHNNYNDHRIELTKMSQEKDSFDVPYEMNFDEEADTISGLLKINYEFSDEIESNLKTEIDKTLRKIKLANQ